MNTSKDIQAQKKHELQNQSEKEVFLRPAVDIYEDNTGITLIADLPGVSREGLDVRLDGNSLVIEGRAAIELHEGMEALYADIVTPHFRRSFTLSNELEKEKINATITDGVLTLHLPKRAEFQPRKIEIKAS
jgi:HSP20 family protein